MENRDLVENILGKVEERRSLRAETGFEWIKGHAGGKGNEEADRLAVRGAREGAEKAGNVAAVINGLGTGAGLGV